MNLKYSAIAIALCASLSVAHASKGDELGYQSTDVIEGWNMYDETTPIKEKKMQEKREMPAKVTSEDMYKVLTEMLLELKDMKLELQKTKQEIKEMKIYINPNAPHYITNSKGEKCLANSSPDCFEMPMIQEARNIPVLKAFMQDPTMENAKNYLGFQAKLFNRANEMGIALRFAGMEGGADVYPTHGKDMMISAKSRNGSVEKKSVKMKLAKYADNIGTVVFLGETPTLEKSWGFESLSRLVYPENTLYNLLLVFKNQEAKEVYDNFYKNLPDKELREVYASAKKKISSEMFTQHNIQVTPSIMAVYKDGKTIKKNIIAKGFPTPSDLVLNYKKFLIFNKIAEFKDFHADNIWRDDNAK